MAGHIVWKETSYLLVWQLIGETGPEKEGWSLSALSCGAGPKPTPGPVLHQHGKHPFEEQPWYPHAGGEEWQPSSGVEQGGSGGPELLLRQPPLSPVEVGLLPLSAQFRKYLGLPPPGSSARKISSAFTF